MKPRRVVVNDLMQQEYSYYLTEPPGRNFEPGFEPDTRLVHGLLHPDVFVDGDNELTAYVIEGEVGRETLHPLRVATG